MSTPTKDSRTTVVLVDDHHIVRQGLRNVLEAEADLAIVGEESDGLRAVALVERVQPAVLVLDLMMPGLNGVEVARQVSKRSPQTRIVVFSMYGSEPYVLEALRNGVAAYVVKEASSAELLKAVREAAAGRRYLSPPLSDRAIEAYLARSGASVLDLYDTLTTREREVLHLAAEGLSSAQVAGRLSISPRTAETHRTNLMRKLKLHSQTDLVHYAMHRGILASDG
jgi:two-component system response regulator NreC